MARTKNAELIPRDMAICADAAAGVNKQEIATKYGVSLVRIYQIISERYEGLTEDGRRDLLVAHYEYLIEKNMKIVNNPPQKVTPSGKLVYEPLIDENGEIVRNSKGQAMDDFSRPIFDDRAVSEATKAIATAIDGIAKLGGLYQKAPRVKDETPEYDKMMADWRNDQAAIRQLEEQKRAIEADRQELASRLVRYESGEIHEAIVIEGNASSGD